VIIAPPQPKFGALKRYVRALILPEDGTRPRFVSIPIRGVLKAYSAWDDFRQHVPDFEEFWPGELNFERGDHNLNVEDQESVSERHRVLHGQYLAYYNRSEELQPNRYLSKIILNGADISNRKFWNRDIFIVKCGARVVETKIPRFPGDPVGELIEVDHDNEGAAIYDDVRPPTPIL
jgi:hypothetical protein